MKKIVFFSGVILLSLLFYSGFSQDQTEALLFSGKFFQADARSTSTGNAFGAIGGNFISSSINPAGLAFYRSSEFSWSIGLSNMNSVASYLGQSTEGQKYDLNIPNIDLVIAMLKKDNGQKVKDGWVSATFAMGINRTNDFNTDREFIGYNNKTSILYNYVEAANGTAHNNLSINNVGGLAWQAYLIDSMAPTLYKPHMSDSNLNLKQVYSYKTRGSAYDINFSFAGNYSNKVYIGGTISIPTLSYHETFTFDEENLKSNSKDYISSNYQQEINVSAYGFQALFGVIFKPIQFLRIGGSVQTPVYYTMTANYNQTLSSVLKDIGNYSASSEGNINYNFTAPFRATASLGVILGKFGFISMDYDFVDYSSAYYSSNDYSYSDVNNRINNIYGATNNLRFGAEFKYDIFSIRGGYDIYGSPYKSDARPSDGDGSSNIISFGIGVRENGYFMDIGYQLIDTKDYVLPYTLQSQNVDGATNELKRSNIIFTLGCKF